MTARTTINANLRQTSNMLWAPIDTIQDVAAKSMRLGVGLAAMVTENIGDFIRDTVEYGEKVERRQLRRLSELQSDTMDRVRGIFAFGSKTYDRAESALGDTFDEVIDELDIPRKSDIDRIDRKLNEIRREHPHLKASASKRTSGAKKSASKKRATKKSASTKSGMKKAAARVSRTANRTASKTARSVSKAASKTAARARTVAKRTARKASKK